MIRSALYTLDPKLRQLLPSAASSYCEVRVVTEEGTLRQLSADGSTDVLILDFDSNFTALQKSFALYSELSAFSIPTIVMIDDARHSSATEILERGVFNCIRKPPSLLELKVVVHRAYEYHVMKRELEGMRKKGALQVEPMREAPPRERPSCGQMVGASPRAQRVYDLINRVADLSALVLITGESGTGKELVARAIHSLSRRAMHPFVAVSCGAIPETLIEAELFGHEKGAYTGCVGAAAGYLERAAEGTLLLDEIGELSLQTQVKLLRVIQQREFTRLGGNRLIPLKARLLFATHRNLAEMVDTGAFRQDLYFRVNVFEIKVPPLRDRIEDLPELARHFVDRYSTIYGKHVADITPDAMESLIQYDWPGNIRELENVIQGAVILADDTMIDVEALPAQLRCLSVGEQSEQFDSFGDHLRQYKIAIAKKAVAECNGNKSLAARKLGVSRAYLHRLIRMPESVDVA